MLSSATSAHYSLAVPRWKRNDISSHLHDRSSRLTRCEELLAGFGRTTLSAIAPNALVRRCAAAAAPAHHCHLALCLVTASTSRHSGRTFVEWHPHCTFPSGYGSSYPFSGGSSSFDCRRACGAPAPTSHRSDVPGAEFDSRGRHDTLR